MRYKKYKTDIKRYKVKYRYLKRYKEIKQDIKSYK